MKVGRRWVKLSYDLSEESPLPPGIPAFSRRWRSSIAQGDLSNLVELTFCNHAGTHIDAPLHFAAGGLSITDFDINDFRFTRPLLLDVPLSNGGLVGPEHLRLHEAAIAGSDLLLVRTGFGHCRLTDPQRYRLHNAGFSKEGARYVAESFPALRGLGLDTASLASMDHLDEGIGAHQTLLGGGRQFLIIEDMNLGPDLSGLREVIALPLMISGLDGSPCTVVGAVSECQGPYMPKA